jgi:hypothetical protein
MPLQMTKIEDLLGYIMSDSIYIFRQIMPS